MRTVRSRWAIAAATCAVAVSVSVLPAASPASAAKAPAKPLPRVWVFPDAAEPIPGNGTLSFLPKSTQSVSVTVYSGDTSAWSGTADVDAAGVPRIPGDALDALPSGTYRSVATVGGRTRAFQVQVGRGWVAQVIMSGQPTTWARCRTITWTYDASGAPAGVSGSVADDFASAAQEMATATGIRFAKAAAGKAADVTVSWPATWTHGAASAMGGSQYRWATGRPATYISGSIELNRDDAWAQGNAAYPRSGLLLHELGHVMGLGHVVDADLVMTPVHADETPDHFAGPENAGLAALYKPSTCR